MTYFRKKPVVIEAQQFTEESKNQVWTGISCTRQPDWDADGSPRSAFTHSKVTDGQLGDRVIRGVKGEFYPCKPDIFEATYEVVK